MRVCRPSPVCRWCALAGRLMRALRTLLVFPGPSAHCSVAGLWGQGRPRRDTDTGRTGFRLFVSSSFALVEELHEQHGRLRAVPPASSTVGTLHLLARPRAVTTARERHAAHWRVGQCRIRLHALFTTHHVSRS